MAEIQNIMGIESEECNNIEGDEKSGSSNEMLQSSTLSKRQRKKLLKLEKWEIAKKEKRKKEREKARCKKLEAIKNGLPTRSGPSRNALKKNRVVDSANALSVVIDLDFDDMMIPKDISKCAKQLLRIYSINRRATNPSQLYFAGITNGGNIHKAVEKNDGYQNWDVHWSFDSILNITKKENLIYLTSDAEEVLTEVKPGTYYIIGGLVDHNHHKGFCLQRACTLGIKTARLPLNEYVEMKTRSVLSTFHVFELLLKVHEGSSWRDAIITVLPVRKGAKAIVGENNSQISRTGALITTGLSLSWRLN